MTDTLIDPLTSASYLPNSTPLNRAFANNLDVFTWFELPENLHRLKRFGVAMHATESVHPIGAIKQGSYIRLNLFSI